MKKNVLLAVICFLIINSAYLRMYAQNEYHELYRPQIHFSPKANWINDPNGMVYYKGIYNLFFQYYPGGTVWGPMHWGHATSKDLIHWEQQPVALYPDSLGYIFSGSAVVDKDNTSGFGVNGIVPLVAIFTHHYPHALPDQTNFQNQSLAYSLDDGKTWVKYANNPVLKNPGIPDFRDPKVMWFAPGKKWVMTLATKDRITFYSSTDLKNWEKESEFGAKLGAHEGVWECPDLFQLDYNGKKVWALIVNLNPGGPNKGSATQYFLGNFDGNKFIPYTTQTKWMDYGPDEYAGVTWNNTGNRKIFLGWMSNWMYANQVPSINWRNAMTLPRELHLKKIGKEMYISSEPVPELSNIETKPISLKNVSITKSFNLSAFTKNKISIPCRLDMTMEKKDFSIIISNDIGEKLIIGFDKKKNRYFIDRTLSGKVDFQKEFAAKHTMPRLSDNKDINFSMLLDKSSIELFADNGLSVMTEIFFPAKPYNHFQIETRSNVLFKKIKYTNLESIWP